MRVLVPYSTYRYATVLFLCTKNSVGALYRTAMHMHGQSIRRVSILSACCSLDGVNIANAKQSPRSDASFTIWSLVTRAALIS